MTRVPSARRRWRRGLISAAAVALTAGVTWVVPLPTAFAAGEVTPIAAIQGTGDASPLAGQNVTTTGVVTASYPTGGFNGFYLQTPGTGGGTREPGQASDAIFVYTGTAPEVPIGACLQVSGTVKEYKGLTELVSPTLTRLPTCKAVKPTRLRELPGTDAAKEALEGMLVRPLGEYTITNNYQLNRYGQVGLAAGQEPLWTATDRVPPAEAAAFEAAQSAREITLDDGSSWDYMRNATAQASPLPYLSQASPMRTGSSVRFTSPVILDYRFQWNFQPLQQQVGSVAEFLRTENNRPRRRPTLKGDVTLASFNVLNYFTDLGQNEEGCQGYTDRFGTPVASKRCLVRGAFTPEALADQQVKIIAALAALKADVIALTEIENSARFGHHRDASLRVLTTALNEHLGREVYRYVESPTVLPVSEDVIRTAFLYRAGAVTPQGPSVILDGPAFANARQPLGQRFTAKRGAAFVAVANHFKSKGSGPDDGTGQGLSNPAREAQASALAAWTQQMWPEEAVFVMGDLNAYSRETPLGILEAAGFTNVVRQHAPQQTSYQFGGRLGSLDHVLANAAALPLVTGAGVLRTNADESVAMQYSRRRYNAVDFHAPHQYAASDHNPVLVGLAGRSAHYVGATS